MSKTLGEGGENTQISLHTICEVIKNWRRTDGT
jgi:hypothetical protein